MPQDPFLYGRPRPSKKQKPSTSASTLDFASQMSSLITSSSGATGTAAMSATGKTAASTGTKSMRAKKGAEEKESVFAGVRAKRRKVAEDDGNGTNLGARAIWGGQQQAGEKVQAGGKGSKVRLKSPTGTFEEAKEREYARKKMEAKAKIYDEMRRGEREVVEEGDRAVLVDFDTKWVNRRDPGHRDFRAESSSPSSEDEDEGEGDGSGGGRGGTGGGRTGKGKGNGGDGGKSGQGGGKKKDEAELIEYLDPLGRTRFLTPHQLTLLLRQESQSRIAQQTLDKISALPQQPDNLILGDTIQTQAFRAKDEGQMEELARKRDRSVTPVRDAHYEASMEGVRERGVGFYEFSSNRGVEMEGLRAEREETLRRRRAANGGEEGETGQGVAGVAGGDRAEEDEEKDGKEETPSERRKREIGERRAMLEVRRKEIEGRRREVEVKRAGEQAESFLQDLGGELGLRS